MENVEILTQKKKMIDGNDDDGINEMNKANEDEKDSDLFNSKLISQEDNTNMQPELLVPAKEPSASAVAEVETSTSSGADGSSKESGTEEILKELRKVKRQNSITHWLLAIMIALTASWQLSEVSLILNVKKKLTNPFKSVGNMFTGAQDVLKNFDGNESDVIKNVEPPSLPPLKIPDLPYMDLPVLGLTDAEK